MIRRLRRVWRARAHLVAGVSEIVSALAALDAILIVRAEHQATSRAGRTLELNPTACEVCRETIHKAAAQRYAVLYP